MMFSSTKPLPGHLSRCGKFKNQTFPTLGLLTEFGIRRKEQRWSFEADQLTLNSTSLDLTHTQMDECLYPQSSSYKKPPRSQLSCFLSSQPSFFISSQPVQEKFNQHKGRKKNTFSFSSPGGFWSPVLLSGFILTDRGST